MAITSINKIKKEIKRRYYEIMSRMLDSYDRQFDKKICGSDLTKYVPSIYRESKGATGSQSTHYRILDEIFKGIEFVETDSLIDVGCGKGRILAYLLLNHFPGKLTGIELNEEVASIPQTWAQRYDNTEIISGDAFELDLTKYNYFFLGRPFETDIFLKFIKKFENEIQKPVTFIYWVSQVNGYFLLDRPGWKQIKQDKVHFLKYHDWFPLKLATSQTPQSYTIYEYNPDIRKEYNGKLYEELTGCRNYSLLSDIVVDEEYCQKYDISFDRTVTGKIYWRNGKWDQNFDRARCFINKEKTDTP